MISRVLTRGVPSRFLQKFRSFQLFPIILRQVTIYRNPEFAGQRNMVMLEYNCADCETKNSEILLSEMYQKNLVIVKCTSCKCKYCLGEQLQWFRDIVQKNPKLLSNLQEKAIL
jgi:hypothetical protein